MFGLKRRPRIDADAHAAEEQRLLGVIWRSATSTKATEQGEATGLLATMYGDPDAATAKLHAYADANSLDIATLWPEPVEDIGPHVKLPVNANPAKDWAKIVSASRQHLSAAPGRLELRDGRWIVRPRVTETWTLAEVKPTDGERLSAEAERRGRTLLSFDPYTRTATVTDADAETERVRRYVASFIDVRPWEIDVTLCTDGDHIEHVVVERVPAMGSAEKRLKTSREMVLGLPGGSTGWRVRDDAQAQRLVLSYGRPAVLPALVPLLPTLERSPEWRQIPMGVDPAGVTTYIDLKLGPHTGVWAPTGAGKTILLLGIMAQALCRGCDVVVVDPSKMGADFIALKPWAAGWADTLPDAATTIRAVYAEVERRRLLCRDYGVGFWEDLPADLRAERNIRPLLLIVDEFVSLALPRTVSKALPKDHPLVVEATEANAHKAEIAEFVGRIAREARFVGVHLALAAQRPDAAIISGEMRSNLTSIIQLTRPGALPSREALGMAFTADTVSAAAETLAELDDGYSRGLAVIAADGGGVAGFRVAYAPTHEIAGRLAELAIPTPRPLPIPKNAAPEPVIQPTDFNPFATFGTDPEPLEFEPVVDTGFSLDTTLDSGVVDLSHLVTDEPADDLWA